MTELKDTKFAKRSPVDAERSEADAMPVVARLVVEIRSDGSRTIARGALEQWDGAEHDRGDGHHAVAVEVEGRTPLELVRRLSASLLSLPSLFGRQKGVSARRTLVESVRRRLSPKRRS